jgi:hypothetical protein
VLHDQDGHDHSCGLEHKISRRAALQLGATAGLAAASAPYLAQINRAGVALAGAQPALAANPNWPVPAIVTRAQWGANEALRKPGQVYDLVKKIVVHHTGTPNEVRDYAALCRGIMNSEVAGEYIDIAYNWLIDPNGRIYEGRWADNYAPGRPHTGERLGVNVRGGHAIYHNTATIGVALMGNYDVIPPSGAMINGLVTLLAWKCARWGLDPNGRSVYAPSSGAPHMMDNITGHRDTSATACPGRYVESMLPQVRARVAGALTGAGYWIASSAGQVLPFGGAPYAGNAIAQARAVAMSGIAGHPSGKGYWLFTNDGAVYAFGANYVGGLRGRRLNAPIVDMAPTNSGQGYWLLGQDGGVFCFGDAKFFGSTGNRRLNAPVLGLVPTPTGNGYWLYARDGGIFCFGDAKFFGSTGNLRLRRPVVAMAARPQGDGYWLIAEDGGVFAFGHAPFRGSWANSLSTSPCVALVPTTTGNGYVMLRKDGGVHAYGDAPNLGGAYRQISGPAVGLAGKLKPV